MGNKQDVTVNNLSYIPRLCAICTQMQEMFDMIMKHKRAMQEMQVMWEKAVREHQHEYDSDEEIDSKSGTWEHNLRKMEMEKTRGQRLLRDIDITVRNITKFVWTLGSVSCFYHDGYQLASMIMQMLLAIISYHFYVFLYRVGRAAD